MKVLIVSLLVASILLVGISFAQFPSNVIVIKSDPNKVVSVTGKLENGTVMNDLSWASKSSVACFPATQNAKFSGNHVLYATTLPQYSEMTITVIPDDVKADFSIYAYQIGSNDYTSIVPNLSSCVACEAEHKWDYPKVGKTQDHTRSVSVNSTTGTYNIIIGVVGSNGLKTGGYTLKIDLKTKETNTGTQATVNVIPVESKPNEITTVKGDLQDGVIINDLSWAWNSAVACFPATQKEKFTGNHVIYSTMIPTHSKMKITVIPDDVNANFSIYAYQIGVNSNAIVPNLSSCVTCEAEHKWDYPKKGKTQDHTRTVELNALNNPYKVIIGVVGANGLKTGRYTLKIDLKSQSK